MSPARPQLDTPCPDLADLLLASEGELPKRRQAEVSAHLHACPVCREQLGSVGLAIREYQDALPARDVDEAEAHAEATSERLSIFHSRVEQERRATVQGPRLSVRRWLPVAAALPVLIGALFFSNRYTSVVRAEELLTRAAAQEQTAPAGTVRRLQFQVRRAAAARRANVRDQWSFTREVAASSAAPVQMASASSASIGSSDDGAELNRLLDASHFDVRDPLSVRSFRAWRDSLRSKTESVSMVGSDAILLRTTTTEGVLRSAELIVRRLDFQPVRQTLYFEGFGEVEIVELSRWVASAPLVAERTVAPAPAAEPATPNTDKLDETEVDVRKALHDVGVDWNPKVAVRRSGQTVEVIGHVDAQQKVEIAHVLTKLPSVKVALRADTEPAAAAAADAAAAAAAAAAASSSPSPNAAKPEAEAPPPAAAAAGEVAGADVPRPAVEVPAVPLRRWIDRTFGHGERGATFIPTLVADAEQVKRRAAAFAALAERYPDVEVNKLNTSARKKLQTLADAQYLELVKSVEVLDDRLALFLGTSTRPALQTSPQPWQAHAAALPAYVERLDRAIRDLLREDDVPLPVEIGPGRTEPPALFNLRQATDMLWEQLRAPNTAPTGLGN